mmetsp:Transcript_31740/g.53324  ORF Transcript_31740/g.53324 Transcript_31740/m.53324 type:complete len:713 (-) Transcript_31740:456-2594(-)|eukprot:CAMPEP_0198211148 /NCGR_PEP_ID=MMETSP1445-20131203/22652_1 /TAXON_ID=36898 /ORGANISM="Pyramimonas sp., Strain CCMP2087" /LENGTH=712 /DNA_ID=CAMNT_0043885359 /DNA_START=169 /DNA_END=2307 /DNA_ORIENTATION=+
MGAVKDSLLHATLLLSVVFSVQAKFIVEHGSLKITNPVEVKGDYDIALANFGLPMYGADLRGVLHYPSGYALACSDTNYPSGFPEHYTFNRIPGYSTIFLLDRGRCRFTEKVINAEKAGANAVLICDNVDEQLITMDAGDDMSTLKYVNNISIPAALLTESDCAKFKTQLYSSRTVVGVIDWADALPHPDARVEWEFWTDSNNGCGDKCDSIMSFLREFNVYSEQLETGGYTLFKPHYLTYHCLDEYLDSRECKEQCLANGQYCSTDPEDDLDVGYTGRDVVLENLRQLCVFQTSNKTGSPFLWWDYVNKFSESCKMSEQQFNKACAERVITTIGLNVNDVRVCMGNADDDHPLLDNEKMAQMGDTEGRGDVTINPTVIINQRHYRGKLDTGAVLKAICAGFDEGLEPDLCNNPSVSENECDVGKKGYKDCNGHEDGKTQCVDTFRGYECACPKGEHALEDADGNEKCQDENECLGVALELDDCNCPECVCINSVPGFKCEKVGELCDLEKSCWTLDVDDKHYSACNSSMEKLKADGVKGISPHGKPTFECVCPVGFTGNGNLYSDGCQNVNECELKCQGTDKTCEDHIGSFTCTCTDGLYDAEIDSCVAKGSGGGLGGGAVVGIIFVLVVVFAIGGYGLYKYRLRSYMDAEIRAIMAQYMPLDKEAEDDFQGGHGEGGMANGRPLSAMDGNNAELPASDEGGMEYKSPDQV